MFTKKQIFIWGPGPDQRRDAFNEEVLYVCCRAICLSAQPSDPIQEFTKQNSLSQQTGSTQAWTD